MVTKFDDTILAHTWSQMSLVEQRRSLPESTGLLADGRQHHSSTQDVRFWWFLTGNDVICIRDLVAAVTHIWRKSYTMQF